MRAAAAARPGGDPDPSAAPTHPGHQCPPAAVRVSGWVGGENGHDTSRGHSTARQAGMGRSQQRAGRRRASRTAQHLAKRSSTSDNQVNNQQSRPPPPLTQTHTQTRQSPTHAPHTPPPSHLYRAGHCLLQRRLHGFAEELSYAYALAHQPPSSPLQQLDLQAHLVQGAAPQLRQLEVRQGLAALAGVEVEAHARLQYGTHRPRGGGRGETKVCRKVSKRSQRVLGGW